jgi:mono/diheme cytochrome c family protein
MTAEQRAAAMKAATVDRQAVFKGDCASCHLPKVEGKYGQQLFEAVCAICHEAKHRATMVPDLHNLNVPTNEEFWRTWITAGKAGSLMPAFATSQGGPLNDLQIASLAAYLNAVNPSKVPPAGK